MGKLKPGPWAQDLFPFRADQTETIFLQETLSAGWYLLCRGVAKLILRTSEGAKFIIRFCKAPQLLNFAVNDIHHYSAVAARECRGLVLSGKALFALAREQPEFFFSVFQHFSSWERIVISCLARLRSLSVQERLVWVLLALGEEHGIQEGDGLRIDLPLSQQDLADLVGASRQTVCQDLQRLAKRGLIRLEGRRIILADMTALRRLG